MPSTVTHGRSSPSPAVSERAAVLRDRLAAFVELTKPGITRLVVLTTAAGFYLGSSGTFDASLFLHTLVGTGLAAGGTNALNQYAERELDARMRRTRKRPLPSGRLRPGEALAFASTISALGILQLLLFVNLATAIVVAAALVSYIFLYTPLKRRSPAALPIGAIPGALPVLAGWTAAGARWSPVAPILFGILFLWQLPHFLALGWLCRADYRAAGFATLGVADEDGRSTARYTLLSTLALIPVTLLPTPLGLSGAAYALVAFLLGLGLLACGTRLVVTRTEAAARRVFLASVLYLPALLLVLVVDKAT